jgi:hypothetical protein
LVAAMKMLTTLVQITALSACFTAYVAVAGEIHLTGMRRAIQIAAGTTAQATMPLPAIAVRSR